MANPYCVRQPIYRKRGQRPTPTLMVQSIIELLWVFPSRWTQMFRKYCGSMVVRCLGSDQALIDEIFLNERTAENDKASHLALCAATVFAKHLGTFVWNYPHLLYNALSRQSWCVGLFFPEIIRTIIAALAAFDPHQAIEELDGKGAGERMRLVCIPLKA
jgi:hypothetical protein